MTSEFPHDEKHDFDYRWIEDKEEREAWIRKHKRLKHDKNDN